MRIVILITVVESLVLMLWVTAFAQKVSSQRLRRLMCGAAMPRRKVFLSLGCALRSAYGPKTLGQSPHQGRSPFV
jgi:hypothetical protein